MLPSKHCECVQSSLRSRPWPLSHSERLGGELWDRRGRAPHKLGPALGSEDVGLFRSKADCGRLTRMDSRDLDENRPNLVPFKIGWRSTWIPSGTFWGFDIFEEAVGSGPHWRAPARQCDGWASALKCGSVLLVGTACFCRSTSRRHNRFPVIFDWITWEVEFGRFPVEIWGR